MEVLEKLLVVALSWDNLFSNVQVVDNHKTMNYCPIGEFDLHLNNPSSYGQVVHK